ncbi:hypothetical protein GCM10009760_21270 [Kitasatospora kazusensis]|uniref:ATP-grasp domain-containing protein n=1 Tax=Kitasatospora kazusensis TaxID=407974 RepID=A0ABN2ZAC4_9ACTN
MGFDPKPTVLILGTDRYLLRACERHDVDAVLVCGSLSWERGLLDLPGSMTVLRVDDQNDLEAVLAALHRAGLGNRAFDAVLTNDEWSLVTAGALARLLGCRGIDPTVALHFRDKYLQKERVRAAGVRTARSTVIEDIYEVDAEAMRFERAVLKPVAGAGTARTSLIGGAADLRNRSEEYRAQRIHGRTFVLEEFVPGDEWVVDGVVVDGRVVFTAVGRYLVPCLDVVDRRLPLSMWLFDPGTEAWAYELAGPLVQSAISALGLRDGVFHLELFHDPETGEVTFSECAARRGGGLTHEEVDCKFGVDLGEAALLCALGRDTRITPVVRPGVVGCSYVSTRPGTLVDSPSVAEVLAQANVEYVSVDQPFGTEFPEAYGTTSQKFGALLLLTDGEDEFATRTEELRDWFADRLVIAPTHGTARELRLWQQSRRDDAVPAYSAGR